VLLLHLGSFFITSLQYLGLGYSYLFAYHNGSIVLELFLSFLSIVERLLNLLQDLFQGALAYKEIWLGWLRVVFLCLFFFTTSISLASLDVGLVADLNWEVVGMVTGHYVRQEYFLMLSWYEDWRTNIKRRDINSGGAQSSIWLAWKRCLVFVVWEGCLLPSLFLLLVHIYLSTLGMIFTNACSKFLSAFFFVFFTSSAQIVCPGMCRGNGVHVDTCIHWKASPDGDVICGGNEESGKTRGGKAVTGWAGLPFDK